MWGRKEKKEKKKEKKSPNNSGISYVEDNKPTEPDVILDIPELKVDEVKVKVENLDAHVSVNAELSNFVNIEAGVEVHVGKVNIEIEDVRAEAYLKVRLERVKAILNRTIQTLDNNPEVLKVLLKPLAKGVGKATGEIGEGAGEATSEIGQGAKGTLSGVGKGAKSLVSKAGDSISNLKLKKGIKKMLSNVNIL